MQREYKAGQIFSFYVISVQEVNDRKYIYLSDGERDTYRVRPYDFQLEWEPVNLPSQINTYVREVNIHGLPSLEQVFIEVLEQNYTSIGEEYAFKITGVHIDQNTQATYYQLHDAFGLSHRYYPRVGEPQREVSDIFSLELSGIEDKGNNRAFLRLSPVSDIQRITPEPSYPVVSSLASPSAIEEEFTLGAENNTREFKSTIIFPAGNTTAEIDRQILIICKTIAGFMNNQGGELYIGVNDRGIIYGIENDFRYLNTSQTDNFTYKPDIDGYENKIRNAVRFQLGTTANANINFTFPKEGKNTYCHITINKVLKPIFMDQTKLFQRTGNMTQLVKGDEITWFVEERWRVRNNVQLTVPPVSSSLTIEPEPEEEDVAIMPAEPVVISEGFFQQDKKAVKVWFYMTFYANGDWSFDSKPTDVKDKVFELPIPTDGKKDHLAMVYVNGRINVVIPYDQIVPKGKSGRKQRKKCHRYNNGWNTESEILDMFLVSKTDLIAIKSRRTDGSEWIKIHKVEAISVHVSLHLAGNVVVNQALEASIVWAKPLPLRFSHLISALIMKNYQTSGFLGFPIKEKSYQRLFQVVEKLNEELA
jgi:hypothetical protein